MGSLLIGNQTVNLGLYDTSTTLPSGMMLGQTVQLNDGRAFRLGRAGATALDVGALCQAADNVVNHVTTRALDTPAVGTKIVNFTPGATAITADQYADGYLIIDATVANTGGASYKIKSHPAAASGAVNLTLYDELWETIGAAATGSLVAHPGAAVVVHPAPPTQALYGVACRDIAINAYGWFQYRGICGVLTEGTVVIGDQVMASLTANGAVAPVTATYAVTYCPVGRCALVSATTLHSAIDLNII